MASFVMFIWDTACGLTCSRSARTSPVYPLSLRRNAIPCPVFQQTSLFFTTFRNFPSPFHQTAQASAFMDSPVFYVKYKLSVRKFVLYNAAQHVPFMIREMHPTAHADRVNAESNKINLEFSLGLRRKGMKPSRTYGKEAKLFKTCSFPISHMKQARQMMIAKMKGRNLKHFLMELQNDL